MKSFIHQVQAAREWANDLATVAAHRTKATFFTRNTARLTFSKLMSFIIGNNRDSAQIALNDFFSEGDDEPVAKQTLFEARGKISHKAFVELNERLVAGHYEDGDYETYKSYTLIGVDGSVFQAPQGALETFGGQKSSRCESVSAQARAVAFTDVLNRLVLKASLKKITDGEQKVFLEMLEGFQGFGDTLFIFDRGFYSKSLAEAIQKKGLKFLFRIKRNCQKDIDSANEPDQAVTVGGDLTLRIINFVLPSGETEKLATNIFDESFTVGDFADIYARRWGVEVSYLMLKERLSIENFTSAKETLMLQDFHAAIVTYNLMEIACMEQERKRETDRPGEGGDTPRSANRNLVAHEVRKLFFEAALEERPSVINKKMARIECVICRFFMSVRPNRVYSRKTLFPNKKFPMNKKRNL